MDQVYNKTSWNTGDPITLNRIMNIENGIEGAYNVLAQQESDIANNSGAIQDLTTGLTSTNTNLNRLSERLDATTNNSTEGSKAWAEVQKAITIDSNGNTTRGIDDRLDDLERDNETVKTVMNTARVDSLGTQYDNFGARITKDELDIGLINQAITSINTDFANAVVDSDGTDYGTIEARFGVTEANLKNLTTDYNAIKQDVVQGRGVNGTSLDARFLAIESATQSSAKNKEFASLDARFEEIENELVATHNNDAFISLDARLDAIDDMGQSNSMVQRVANLEGRADNFNAQISSNAGNIASLQQNKVNVSDIVNNTNTPAGTEGKVLDARVGKTLKDAIDDVTTTANSNATKVAALEEEVRMDLADGSRRLDTIETNVSNLQNELGATHNSTANDASYQDLDERLEADETSINSVANSVDSLDTRTSTLQGRVQLIANELGMIQNDIYTNENTVIDQISSELSQLSTAVGDMGEFGGRLNDVETAVETLDTDINGTNGVGGLKNRMTAAENAISHAANPNNNDAGGLTERMTAVETAASNAASAASAAQQTANAAATQSSLNTLAERVTTLEGKDTVIVSNVTYDAETGDPEITSPSQNCDYLLKGANDDPKYYYWRYFGSTIGWQMISSAGGGTGNSSGYDYLDATDYDELEEHSENTDYYVQRNDGFHHYRWVYQLNLNTGEEELTEIEIGTSADIANIKKYNVTIEEETNEQTGITTSYLCFYEFNYGVNNAIDTSDNTPVVSGVTPLRRIPLPAGSGGGGGTTTNIKFSRITPRIFTSSLNSENPTKVRFFFTTGEANDGAYYDVYIGRIVQRGNTTVIENERKVIENEFLTSGDPANKSISWPTTTEGGVTVEVPESSVTTGFYAIDISEYCNQIAHYNIRLEARLADNQNVTGSISWELHTINFQLTSTSPDGLIVSTDSEVSLEYTPFGTVEKTLHVVIDNDTEHEQTVYLSDTTSGRSSSIILPTQTHGLHKIDMYMDALINGVTVPTQHIYREYIWYDEYDETAAPIIVASRYNNQTIDIDSYTEFSMPYSIYHAGNENYVIEYYLNYNTEDEELLEQIQANGNVISQFDYIPINTQAAVEVQTLTIKVGNQIASVTLNVKKIDRNLSPVSGALIDFDPSSYTNNSINREPVLWKTNVSAYDSVNEWAPDTSYLENSRVKYDGYIYSCREMNRDLEWTPSHWTEVAPYEYKLKVSDNFNWSNDISGGGYKEDSDGKCFVVKAGSYVDINYKMFKNLGGQSAVYENGAEMKIIFKTSAVRRADAVWFTNVKTVNNKQIGIQLGAHVGWLKTDKASDGGNIGKTDNYDDWVSGTSYNVGDIVVYDRANDGTIYKCLTANDDVKLNKDNWLKIGQVESAVDATNTYLYFPYSEEDKIELDININQHQVNMNNDFIMSYEDGVPSKALPYTYGAGGDGLYHLTGDEATIRIGSADCDVYIYRLRIYGNALATDQILQNFIADGKTVKEKIERYDRNAIYWDSSIRKFYTTKSATAILDPVKLAEKMPGVKVLMLEAPTFTLHKKSYIRDSSLRCLQIQIDSDGIYHYPEEGNWFFQHGYHAGQGTTSDNYGQAGRNVDFLFECDGVNYPATPKDMTDWTADGNYKSTLLRGNSTSIWTEIRAQTEDKPALYTWVPAAGAVEEECTSWKGDDCKIQLTPTSVPNNYFNLKVNIASSENVNNALFQKRFNDYIASIAPSPATVNQNAYHNYASDDRFTGPITAKNSMEFVPAVLFIRETKADSNGNPVDHSEFNDCEWHFYALGNIGDSKKTDYTRAYDPTDMNEFTLECSDNNTNNSQFQSGVYESGGVRTVEQAESNINTMEYVWGITNEQWNATRQPTADEMTTYVKVKGGDKKLVNVIMNATEADGSDGQVYVNYRHRMLSAEPFDGDHSFEFRYACKGDYRDGKLVNAIEGSAADKAQETLNRGVFEAFYEWLVTANDTQFEEEAELWFVPAAMEFFYAYTHYYTMMDNRAKNTFWHYAKTGVRHAVPIGRAVPALMHIYEESDGNGGYQPASGAFDNTKQYYTQYAFDLWAYDMDTAAGIDNNGALVFPYGKEDDDYRTEGDALSGMAFNGAGSIFWRRLKTAFSSDIRDVMTSAPVNCFNAQHLIDEFDATQECYPEEVWRLDIERKYIRTFTGVNNSISALKYDNSVADGKQNPRFLRSMMQGRKKYQRRQWIRDQGVYFNSKYRLNDIIRNDNTIEFNATTPAVPEWVSRTNYYINDYVRTRVEPFDEMHPQFQVWRCIEANNDSTFNAVHWQSSVTPSYMLSLVPYQDMYLNVQVGNGNYKNSYVTDGEPSLRAKAGQEYIFDISGNKQETRIYINGANSLSSIGNLAPMYPYEFDLRALAHLKNLDIGTDDATYSNTKFTTLGLETSKPLLEKINVKNCHSLGGALNLQNANNIREVEATGTSITTVNLPQYTNIEKLHLPITTTDVALYAARQLTDFKIVDNNGNIDYSNITKLEVIDSDYSENINWMDIASAMLANAQTLKLLDLRLASIGNIQVLEPFSEAKDRLINAGVDQIVLGGTITVTGDYSAIEKSTYEAKWHDYNLHLNVDNGHFVTKHKVDYYYDAYLDDDGNTVPRRLIKTLYVNRGDPIPDIWTDGTLNAMPSRDDTAREHYQFGLRSDGAYVPYSGWKYSGSTSPLSTLSSQERTVDSDMSIETYFRTTTRQYEVRWYLEPNQTNLVKVATTGYGDGYALSAPTVQEVQSRYATVKDFSISGGTVIYNIFNGWEKLPININPSSRDTSYDIYAVWLHKEIPLIDLFDSSTLDLNNLTVEQVYVLSRMTAAQRAQYIPGGLPTGAKMTCRLGNEGPDDGTLIIGTTQTPVLRTDAAGFDTASGITNLKPFTSATNGFTLVLDYCFNMDQVRNQISNSNKNFAILASTYYVNSGSTGGFSLFYNLNDNLGTNTQGPRIGFGDMFNRIEQSIPLGHKNAAGGRNIVVLRCVYTDDNTTVLHIYSGFSTTGAMSIPNDISYNSITWNGPRPDTKLIFGSITEILNSSNSNYNSNYSNIIGNSVQGMGTIYWAKYWNYDLGEGECRSLAEWPHEEITYGITRASASASGASASALSLTSLESSTHGVVVQPSLNYATQGWGVQEGGAVAREICNNRLFFGLPILLQSILFKSSIAYKTVSTQETLYGTSYQFDTNTQYSDDYIYLPSIVNIASSTTGSSNDSTYSSWRQEDSNGAYPWVQSANITVYENYVNSNKRWTTNSSSTNNKYFNLRFPYQALPVTSLRVFRGPFTAGSGVNSVYDAIKTNQNNIESTKVGDIFDDTTNGIAYIFVDTATIKKYGVQYKARSDIFDVEDDSGAWVPAIFYSTRSMMAGQSAATNYCFITTQGEGNTSAPSALTNTGFNLSYSFEI